jgi:hypothetical protein
LLGRQMPLLLGNLCRDSLHLAKAGQISKVALR